MNKKQKVVVISIDAMMESDIAVLAKLKNTGKLLEKCAIVRNMMCTFPSYTYPCHVSISTGCWPEKHGIYQNEYLDLTGTRHEWFWYADAIKCPDCFAVAKQHGLTTAAINWPVTGANPNIDYRIAEIWTIGRTGDQMPVHEKADSANVLDIVKKNLSIIETYGFHELEYDKFANACGVEILRKYSPDLFMIHYSVVDDYRHHRGAETEKIADGLEEVDKLIGDLIQAVKDNGDYDNTSFVLLGDHGQLNVDTVFKINTLLARKGYITLDSEGKITDWKIFLQSGSFSGEVFIQNIEKEEAFAVLNEIKKAYPQFIERVMTKDTARELYRVDGPFEFVVVAQDGIVFSQKVVGELTDKPVVGDYRYSIATHGYVPEKGPMPPFIICGDRAKAGTVMDFGRLIDEAPTFMSLFGLTMPDADGRILDIIKK